MVPEAKIGSDVPLGPLAQEQLHDATGAAHVFFEAVDVFERYSGAQWGAQVDGWFAYHLGMWERQLFSKWSDKACKLITRGYHTQLNFL